MQDIKISLPPYKMIYSICFIIILSLIRGISSVREIGSAVDINMALLAIVFCSDTYYSELKGDMWESFCLFSMKKKMKIIRRRVIIQYLYLTTLSAICYALFYMQKPYVEIGVNEINLFFLTILAALFSIIFFEMLSLTLVHITKNIWVGIGISVLIWLILCSAASFTWPIQLQIFGFAGRNITVGNENYLWIWGKVTALLITIVLIMLQPSCCKVSRRGGTN